MADESFHAILEDTAGVCIRCGKMKIKASHGVWGYVFGKVEKECYHRWGKLPDEDVEAIKAIINKHVGRDFWGKPIGGDNP